MWWPEDSWVSDQIERLLGAWREGLLPSVTAIGSTWMESGERTLFVGVDSRLDPRPSEWAPGNGAVDRVTRALIRRYGPLPPPRPAEEVPVTSGRGGAQVLDRPRARSRDALMLLASLRLSRSRREAVDLV